MGGYAVRSRISWRNSSDLEKNEFSAACAMASLPYLIGAADVAASWIVEPMVTQLMWPAKADKIDYVSLRNVAAVTRLSKFEARRGIPSLECKY